MRPEYLRLETGRDNVILRDGGKIFGYTGALQGGYFGGRPIHYFPTKGRPAALPPILSAEQLEQLAAKQRGWLRDIKGVPPEERLDDSLATIWNTTPAAAKKRRQRLYTQMSLIRHAYTGRKETMDTAPTMAERVTALQVEVSRQREQNIEVARQLGLRFDDEQVQSAVDTFIRESLE
jgi:hypothetical protein